MEIHPERAIDVVILSPAGAKDPLDEKNRFFGKKRLRRAELQVLPSVPKALAFGLTMTSVFGILAFLGGGILQAQEIQGHITLAPPYPQIRPVKVEKKKQDSCADLRMPDGLRVSEAGDLQNAVVWLEGNFKRGLAPGGQAPFEVMIDQKACRFEPHVLIVQAGKKFQVRNSDPLAHDVRGFDGPKMLFRFEMGPEAPPVTQSFERPGIYVLRCGFHTWMHGLVVNAPHAYYAVSDEKGRFVLKNVPPGNYQIHLWHETLGEDKAVLAVSKPVENFSYTFKQQSSIVM